MDVVHAAEAERAEHGSELRKRLLIKAGVNGEEDENDQIAPNTLAPVTIIHSGEVETDDASV